MNSCQECGTKTDNPKFCSRSCNATYQNRGRNRHGTEIGDCLNCGNRLSRSNQKYCNYTCVHDHKYKQTIKEWKAGNYKGLDSSNGTVTNPIKRFLREKYDNKCSLCGWSKINPHTGKVPLVADHIDGNYKNNTEENLRLICWNCDSLGSTFGSLNNGNGRENRYD